jgi:hypothetical protein
MHSKPTLALPRDLKFTSSPTHERKIRRVTRRGCLGLLEKRLRDGTLATVIRHGVLCVVGAQVSRMLDMENYNFYRSFEKAHGYPVEHAPHETAQMIRAGIVSPQVRSVSFVRLSDLRSYLTYQEKKKEKKASTRPPSESKGVLDTTPRAVGFKSLRHVEAEAIAVAGLLLLAAKCGGVPCSTTSA